MTKTISEILQTMDYGTAPESPTEALKWLDGANNRFTAFINGEFSSSISGNEFSSICPADERHLATVCAADQAAVESAAAAARAAQPGWEKTGGTNRAKYLYAIARNLQKHARLFAVLESLDNGKPIRESRDIDIPLAVRHFYYHAGMAKVIDLEYPNTRPMGVIGQMISWNFPLLMLAWKIAPALAAGNTVVIKPAQQTPLSAMLFAEICQRVGLPRGVVNIVNGSVDTAKALIDCNEFDMFAFTGSTAVGRSIMQANAGRNKPLLLELGGKSPVVVFETADLDSAVEGVADGVWFNQGQVCCAGTRLFMQESIAERFMAKLKNRMQRIRVGHPLDKNSDMGALIDAARREHIRSVIAGALAEGAEAFSTSGTLPEKGFYCMPTLLSNVPLQSTAFTEEIFGPVLVSATFRTTEEAVELANDTRYGLSAGIWAQDIDQALGVVPRIAAGVIWVNCANLFDASCEFGGVKETGFGREGGRGIRAYLTTAVTPANRPTARAVAKPTPDKSSELPAKQSLALDKTCKLFINGKQVRPDSGYSIAVKNTDQDIAEFVGAANRKDVRNAVEAAVKAESWRHTSAYQKSQIMYYLAENLERSRAEFTARLQTIEGKSKEAANADFEAAVERLMQFAARTEHNEGRVHRPPLRGIAMTLTEPVGVIGIICPEYATLAGALTLTAAAVSAGNRCILVAPETNPLLLTDFYRVIESSDVPPGVINILTGNRDDLLSQLAAHHAVDALWCFADAQHCRTVETAAAGNLKRVFCSYGTHFDMQDPGFEDRLLIEATELKTVWIPFGE